MKADMDANARHLKAQDQDKLLRKSCAFKCHALFALHENQIQIEIKLEVIEMAQIIETTGKNGVTVSVIWNGKRAYFSCVKEATDWLAKMKREYELERIEVFLRQIVLMARKEYKYESCYSL